MGHAVAGATRHEAAPIARRPARAFVALGANLGDPRRAIVEAIDALGELPGTRLLSVSSLYRSAPIDSTGPDFLNAVVEIETPLAPEALLDALQAIERAHGRDRPYANAPRTLDLDLLLHGEGVVDTVRLRLPHPRMHLRAFVLAPLAEIDPMLRIPGQRGLAELLDACSGQRVERILDAQALRAELAGRERRSE